MNAKTLTLNDIAVSVLLAQRRMSRKELCRIAGINQGNFSTMLKRGTVRPKTACAIADALGVDVTEITITEGDKTNGKEKPKS